MAELLERSSLFASQESWRRGLAFQPRPSDIIISPFPKCGTTWTQQIVHSLRTRGSMDFEEITAAVPWLELAYDLGLDLEGPQPHPRAFKSHLTWDEVPKGGRYIYVVRDPLDALVSIYRFFEGWWFEAGSITITDFARHRFLNDPAQGGYWHHLAAWWPQRQRPEVLILCYEAMHADPPQTIRTIANFIGCALDDDLLALVLEQSSLAFMQAHRHQFDDHLIRQARDPVMGLPPGGDSAKVRTGRVGDHRYDLTDAIRVEMAAIWTEQIEARFGLPSYQALREALARGE
jgi:hypothetical protein